MDIAFTPGRRVNYLPQYLLVAKPKGVAAEIVADTGRNRFGDRTCTLRLLEDAPGVTLQGFEAAAIPAGTVIDAYDRQVRAKGRIQVVAYATAFYHKRFEVEADTPHEAGEKVAAMLAEDVGDGWTALPELTPEAPADFDYAPEGSPDFEPDFNPEADPVGAMERRGYRLFRSMGGLYAAPPGVAATDNTSGKGWLRAKPDEDLYGFALRLLTET